jgi:hypothetical protein
MIKALVATKETQGQRKNDFSWCDEGELVTFAFECDGETIDGSCGCRRAMAGLVSHTATTTFKVAEVEITPLEYLEAVTASNIKGWGDKPSIRELSRVDCNELIRLAEVFPVGTILEKRGNKIQERKIKGGQV